jgi:phage tail P2-like protein
MTRPTVHAGIEQVYRLLPDFIRAADENNDYTVLRYLGGAAISTRTAVEVVTSTDPDTSVTGTSEMVNPSAAPRSYLGWLGWLVGIDVSTIDDPYVRDAIANATATQRRGSASAIRAVVQRTLTGSKNCRVYTTLSGSDPYLITVVTTTSQTPSESATLAAAWTEKPAGMDLELTTVANSTYGEVKANFTDYDDVDSSFADYTELNQWIAP